jgi:hypothetical protein
MRSPARIALRQRQLARALPTMSVVTATERLSAIFYHITCIICYDTRLDCVYEVCVEWAGGFGHDELRGGVCRLQSNR